MFDAVKCVTLGTSNTLWQPFTLCFNIAFTFCLQNSVFHMPWHTLKKPSHCHHWNAEFQECVKKHAIHACCRKLHAKILILKWSKQTVLYQKRRITRMCKNDSVEFSVANWAIYLEILIALQNFWLPLATGWSLNCIPVFCPHNRTKETPGICPMERSYLSCYNIYSLLCNK